MKRTATKSFGDVGFRGMMFPLIGSITPTDKIYTERSTAFGAYGSAWGGLDGTGDVVFVDGAGKVTAVDFLLTICRVAFPCARVPEVALGTKMIEIGILAEDVPERVGIRESEVLVLGILYDAPHGIAFKTSLTAPGVFNTKFLSH